LEKGEKKGDPHSGPEKPLKTERGESARSRTVDNPIVEKRGGETVENRNVNKSEGLNTSRATTDEGY